MSLDYPGFPPLFSLACMMSAFLLPLAPLFQTPPPPAPAPAPSFWQANGDAILAAVVTAILVLIFSEAIKALLKKLGGWLERGWQVRFKIYRVLTGGVPCSSF